MPDDIVGSGPCHESTGIANLHMLYLPRSVDLKLIQTKIKSHSFKASP